jgi:hypothetical protein
MLSLAEQAIFDRYHHPDHAGAVEHASHTASFENASCGDSVTLTAMIQNNQIIALKHATIGCAICTAAADLLCEHYLTHGRETSFNPQVALDIPINPSRQRCASLAQQCFELLQKSAE